MQIAKGCAWRQYLTWLPSMCSCHGTTCIKWALSRPLMMQAERERDKALVRQHGGTAVPMSLNLNTYLPRLQACDARRMPCQRLPL